VERLEATGFAHPYEHIEYQEAGHLIRIPYWPTVTTRMMRVVFGGAMEANAAAGADAWRRALRFLAEHS
jgi:hypothetical protein